MAKNVAPGSKNLVILATGTFSLDDMDVTVLVVETESRALAPGVRWRRSQEAPDASWLRATPKGVTS